MTRIRVNPTVEPCDFARKVEAEIRENGGWLTAEEVGDHRSLFPVRDVLDTNLCSGYGEGAERGRDLR